MKVTDRKWRVFRIGEIFDDISRPVSRSKNQYASGDIPFIASGASLNGTVQFCKPHTDELLDAENCITVSPVDGSCFYQPIDFLGRGGGGSSIIMLRSRYLNQDNGVFLAKAVNHTTSKYQYGHMATSDGIKRERILLPVDDKGQPDYQFMADYERELVQHKREQYVEYVTNRLEQLGPIKTLKSISETKWSPVCVSDIGDVLSGHDIYARERIKGPIPYITSGSANNGIGYFVGNDNKSKDSDVISVNRNGAVGEAFYHPYTALFGNDCRKVKLKQKYEYAPFFIAAMLSKQKKAFSYSRKLGTARLKRLRIMLPVNDQGQPDYDYMEQYVKNLMIKKYQSYLDYLQKH
ncbi:hypothetical protein DQM14_01955 [Limosilactobacillus fermentum]|uniref:restriction endonuclease subunit S n=1 Tax=Limosilactobacillus fermentum TaxID=1613 RepID=UPI000E0967BB|nr:restriction endonuclease subunit S [Limosilactobacillus fermentum]RDG20871.1 hypothetical protein DQM14_01955 [Limosilactobacillus fermentum]